MDREFKFTDSHFNHLRKLVVERTGINLSEAKRELVYGRLSRRLRKLGIDSFGKYYQLLRQGHKEELEQFTNAITTNLTSFFREPHHFDYLAQTVVPELMDKKNRVVHPRLRIWCAGCSSGEEAYSIAMVLKETIVDIDGIDAKILATDLDSNVLAIGRAAVYDQERVEGLSKQRLKRWFLRGSGKNDGMVKVVPELRELIRFHQLNLMHDWPMRGLFDVIFCRNVVIYFDKATQKVLFDRCADILEPNGHLFVGHSENLFKIADRFHAIEKSTYRKIA
jgi:chemotaxis protein methyltransferase CheR